MTVIRTDSALWKRLVSGKEFENKVYVGIPEEAGQHEGAEGISVATLGQILHDGTSVIPARPFLAAPLDGRTKAVQAISTRITKAVLDGKLDMNKALNLLGQWARDAVIKAINAHSYAPNAPSTISQKGSSTPLVDTSQLRGSITYEIRP